MPSLVVDKVGNDDEAFEKVVVVTIFDNSEEVRTKIDEKGIITKD